MSSTLANAINECRHITPEELIRDNIKAIPGKEEKQRYIIQYVNNYGHIVKDIYTESSSEKQVIEKAKQEKLYYPECYIEILNLDTRKRIYA
jgi:hypothetical protein